MSTNYYLHLEPCDKCGVGPEPLHIGKRAGGWSFMLHVNEEIKNLEDWIAMFPKGEIRDEYGGLHTPEWMQNTILYWPGKKHLFSNSEAVPGRNYTHQTGEFS